MMKDTYISDSVLYVGVDDKTIDLFESQYVVPNGVSYNSYVIMDDEIAIMDTVDPRKTTEWLANVEQALAGRKPDYLVIHHMEPDHAATLGTVLSRYPEATVIGNAKTLPMIKQFFPMEVEGRFQAVKEGDTLSLGRHELTFVMAPLVHWPEVMMTYDTTEKALFSADAFGTFGAMDGNIFADEVNFEQEWLDDARRYYTNIVGKYGTPVQNVLKKAAGLDIQYLCPLHGPIWRENIGWFLEKYKRWSTYTPEAWTAAIFCGSIYGHTENACEILASRLAEKGVRHVRIFDVSHTDVSEQVSAAFQCSHLVFASATYNGGIYTPMETLLLELKAHALQNRTVALIENGSWGPAAARLMAGPLVIFQVPPSITTWVGPVPAWDSAARMAWPGVKQRKCPAISTTTRRAAVRDQTRVFFRRGQGTRLGFMAIPPPRAGKCLGQRTCPDTGNGG